MIIENSDYKTAAQLQDGHVEGLAQAPVGLLDLDAHLLDGADGDLQARGQRKELSRARAREHASARDAVDARRR